MHTGEGVGQDFNDVKYCKTSSDMANHMSGNAVILLIVNFVSHFADALK